MPKMFSCDTAITQKQMLFEDNLIMPLITPFLKKLQNKMVSANLKPNVF